jgi:ATP-dependent RNA helicase SUPV3L1/SUV3
MIRQQASSTMALLGPTNTGKTHRAVERMLEHQSGMIGLPLRLLAREVYDRVTARVGEEAVALLTGEEKRIGKRARYWVCTVESMPVSLSVDFLAIDEIQLAAHPGRGHVFTDRLLHARGEKETWLLGADTMRQRVAQLLPTAQIHAHPRFSQLSAVTSVSLRSLAPRTVVVAFSAAEVYDIADRLRRKRGGAAVVLGALSPRARNAQVAMYQSGEVDLMVATDAIGMGLNMDVDHVVFASLRKFDGQRQRGLTAAEVGQIAGRAGRYLRDGQFGGLSPLRIPSQLAFAVEQHRFAAVEQLVWRHHDLDFGSLDGLLASLQTPPRLPHLRRVERADDSEALRLLSADPEIRDRAGTADGIALLWEVCRIPDFRKLLIEHHVSLLRELFLRLAVRGTLDADFLDERLQRLETTNGDIDALMMRMEFIRTWSYIVHRSGWIDDAAHFQARTVAAEDSLSDALHERLVERFVERRGRHVAARSRGRLRRAPSPQAEPVDAQNPFASLQAFRSTLPSAQPEEPSLRDDWIDHLIDAASAVGCDSMECSSACCHAAATGHTL